MARVSWDLQDSRALDRDLEEAELVIPEPGRTRSRLLAVCATFGIATSALLFSLSVDPPKARAAVDVRAQRKQDTTAMPLDAEPPALLSGDPFGRVADDTIDTDELKRIDAQSRLTLLVVGRVRIQREIRQVTTDALGPPASAPLINDAAEASALPGAGRVDPDQRTRARGRLALLSRNLAAIVLEARTVRMHLGELDSRSASN